MKKVILLSFIFCFALSAFASCNSYAPSDRIGTQKGVTPDSTVYATLGKTLSDILFNPGKVNLYKLKGKDSVEKNDVEIESHYVRDSYIGKVRPEVFSILQFNVISDPINYQRDSVLVKAPYYPEYELEFVKGKKTAHVLISVNDKTWTIIYDDKRQFNWNYADKRSMDRFMELLLETIKK